MGERYEQRRQSREIAKNRERCRERERWKAREIQSPSKASRQQIQVQILATAECGMGDSFRLRHNVLALPRKVLSDDHRGCGSRNGNSAKRGGHEQLRTWRNKRHHLPQTTGFEHLDDRWKDPIQCHGPSAMQNTPSHI